MPKLRKSTAFQTSPQCIRRRLGIVLGLISLASAATAARAGEPSPSPAALFAYDATLPLDVQEGATTAAAGGVIIHDVTYASPKGGRVPAYLVVPPGKGPFAAILFGHWGGGDRTEFLAEAILDARAGAVCLLPAYPWVRPAPWRHALQYLSAPENDVEAYVQAVIDLRRGLDLLLARPDVDARRVAYVGHSYGAQWGAILAAEDRRMKTAVLVAGVPDAETTFLKSAEPDLVELRTQNQAAVEHLVQVESPLDAVRFVPRAAPMPLLFQFASFEPGWPLADSHRYFAAASQPKAEKWYPTGHELNDPQALADRAAWLRQQVGLGQVRMPAASD
jgi:dienelactone hydrolase